MPAGSPPGSWWPVAARKASRLTRERDWSLLCHALRLPRKRTWQRANHRPRQPPDLSRHRRRYSSPASYYWPSVDEDPGAYPAARTPTRGAYVIYYTPFMIDSCKVYGCKLRGWRRDGKQRTCLCPLSWSIHHNITRDGYIESTCCCVQARFLGMETKIHFTLLWYVQCVVRRPIDNLFPAFWALVYSFIFISYSHATYHCLFT